MPLNVTIPMGFESRLAQFKDKFLSIVVRTILYEVSLAHSLQGKSFKNRGKAVLTHLVGPQNKDPQAQSSTSMVTKWWRKYPVS